MYCPKCHTPLADTSRFCSGCGSPIAAPAAHPHAAQPTTQLYQPTAQHAAQPTMAWQQPPAYAHPQQVTGAFAAPVPRRKPWVLLSILTAIVAVAVGAGAFALTRGRSNAVTATSGPGLPSGPGVAQSASSQLPPGPGVVASQGSGQPYGAPVAGAAKGADGMAPSVLMSGANDPNGSSVTSVQQPRIPTGPSVTAVSPVTPQPGAPIAAAPAAPVPDNSDFDKYLRWLRFVEQERAGLRAQGETVAFQQIEGYLNAMLTLADPDGDGGEGFMQQNQRVIQDVVVAIRNFRNNIGKSRQTLMVPSDCKALDAFYMKALDQETEATGQLLTAMASKNIGQIRAIGKSGVGSIDMNLGQANRELKKVYEARGLNQLFTIETGGNSSLLGGMTGISGLK